MKLDIILAGVGGQGILSIATVIGAAALRQNLFLKQSEVHGMSQRGGDVQAHLRLSDRPIASDLIPGGAADLIVSLEPMEALRYLPFLKADGAIITALAPFLNIDNYPSQESVGQELVALGAVILDVEQLAAQCSNPKGANMVLLGAASPYLKMEYEALCEAVKTIFARKGEAVIAANIRALDLGRSQSVKT